MRTTPAGVKEALTDLPALELVIQGEARSAAHRLLESGILVLPSPQSRTL
jgi:hypothetical protein